MSVVCDFEQRVAGAYAGGAIGDAMGAPVEGWGPDRIAARFPEPKVDAFLPPCKREPDGSFGKGDGRITDDTLMVEALIDAYAAHGDHMDAYGWVERVLPNIADRLVFVPERQREMPLVERLWWPEKYPFIRLRCGGGEPRTAGVGNCVNCGVAMYAWPTGAINAGDPAGAYREATTWGMAHNESFAVEAAGVMAAATAAAFTAGGVASAIAAALDWSKDGTATAIKAGLAAANASDPWAIAIQRIRAAVAPFDQRTGHSADDSPHQMSPVNDVGRPSRLAAIEELPVALAALAWGGDDWRRVLGLSVWYGRDNDSIAGMAMTLWGAAHGIDALPASLVEESQRVNRRDYRVGAAALVAAAKQIQELDAKRLDGRARTILGRAS